VLQAPLQACPLPWEGKGECVLDLLKWDEKKTKKQKKMLAWVKNGVTLR
jgi:hypothetical protein